ncbi:hypothetical protein EXIGLDRAFT_176896 [Exidia glandulosa HHB12029]|uniref:Uncharacterized protein n=1 Tax=Exidia glandulosa HHB12029 TaxID=1314781 RepID=A0A165N313_EXIGL|nr:hypothetical protein EXIGLDRAFT_176896 [Exidia glandulosa HHB12029]
MANIVHIVATWLFNGKMPAVSDKDLELVRLGFGHLIPDAGISADNIPGNGLDSPLGDPNVEVSENLVAASLVGLLDDDDEDEPHSLLGYVDRRFSDFPVYPSSGGFAYEDLLIFCLCQVLTLEKGALLDSLFDFCYLPPSWRKKRARLIGVFSIDSGGTKPILVPHKLTTRLAWSTSSIEDTLHWFGLGKASSLRVPFLKPDHFMGVDVVFALRLSGGHQIFVMLQSKCWSQKHSPGEVELAVWRLSPEGYYYVDTKKEETKAIRNEQRRFEMRCTSSSVTQHSLWTTAKRSRPRRRNTSTRTKHPNSLFFAYLPLSKTH